MIAARLGIFISTLALMPAFAAAASGAESCLPSFVSLQAFERLYPERARQVAFPLRTEGPDGLFGTKALLTVEVDPNNGELRLTAAFDPNFDGVSLAYNLYAVQVVLDGNTVAWTDFTNQCRGPGVSFFPGGSVRLPKVKLVGRHEQTLQIMVWGRL